MSYFPFGGVLDESDDIDCFTGTLAAYTQGMRGLSPSRHLSSFLGYEADARSYGVQRIDHVALYAGDYRVDQEFEAWFERLLQQGVLSDVETGPSYIAPRHYGTQGYWISAALSGAAIELFAMKRAGNWQKFSPLKKAARMSHIALGIDDRAEVLPVLTRLAGSADVSILSYSPDDELSHCYGHVLNSRTDEVLEIVHTGKPQRTDTCDSCHLGHAMEGTYGLT